MNERMKGLIFLVVGNIMYSVIPVWITQYMLTLPNPFYSIGAFFSGAGTFVQSLSNLSSFGTGILAGIDLNMIKQVIGISFIGYALYVIAKSFYK
jgi:hypothetical protein